MFRKLFIVSTASVLWFTFFKPDKAAVYPTYFYEQTLAAHERSINGTKELPETLNTAEHITTTLYPADIRTGVIGSSESEPVDDPFDNVFQVSINEPIEWGDEAVLQYELYGLLNASCIPKIINNQITIGGKFIALNKGWTKQSEELPAQILFTGNNIIIFNTPDEIDLSYHIRNLSIVIRKNKMIREGFRVTHNTSALFYDSSIYLSGFISKKGGQLFCNDIPARLENGLFEMILPYKIREKQILHWRYVGVNADSVQTTTTLSEFIPASITTGGIEHSARNEAAYQQSKALELCLERNRYAASLLIPAGSFKQGTIVSISTLQHADMPALGTDLVNVTGGAKGYRFLPHGAHFTKTAFVDIPYDSSMIPEGYTVADIRTYFFEEKSRQWMVLPLDTALKTEHTIRSLTTHFTDMINGIIKVPESPQTLGYTPTSIKDLKAADPSAGINLMAPPEAISNGAASIGFEMKVPRGRAGLQPQLGLRYSNEAGNGWMGVGWNLTMPAVMIDTRWGAPRYDKALETEAYSLNGEALAPVINRSALSNREIEKRFYPRVEGTFNKIVRHGNNPANYWWEVINKNGTRNFYGGLPGNGVNDNAVLKDAAGNIGYWALAETRDINNNHIRYQYKLVKDPGIAGGTVPGQQLYIDRIFYTGHNGQNGPYTIDFIRDRDLSEAKRKDGDINGTLGFKMVTADLLRKVVMKINGTPIRTYTFNYTEGAYFKTLLQSVIELDAADQVFYTHTFEYYDDVDVANGYKPLQPPENWNPQNDDISGNLINDISGFSDEGSALSSSLSSNYGGDMSLTFGLIFGKLNDKSLSIGGKAGFSSSDDAGLVSIVDITGDALPDKIISKGDQLYYRRNLGINIKAFGELKPIAGLSQFSESNTESFNWGVEVIPQSTSFTYETTSSTNTVTTFFSDFNSDGLTDMNVNGTILYNHLDSNGEPVFETGSTRTPNPIFTGFGVDKKMLAPDTALQAQLEQQYPLQDAIRLWKAPFSGNISIVAPVHLRDFGTGTVNKKKDGVRVSIQKGNLVLWASDIDPNDFSPKFPTGLATVAVTKGQYLYFRVQSKFNGEEDEVYWNPLITYLNTIAPTNDANKKLSNTYSASEDFILSNKNGIGIPKEGILKIEGRFKKQKTSDSLWATIIKTDTFGISRTLFKKLYSASTIADENIVLPAVNVKERDLIYFNLSSDSYLDKTDYQWRPTYTYTSFTDGTPATDKFGNPVYSFEAVPDKTNYNEWIIQAASNGVTKKDTVKIKPLIKGLSSANGNITFTVKGQDTIYGKSNLIVLNGNISGTIPEISLIRELGQTYYFDYASPNRTMALALSETKAVVSKDSGYINTNGVWVIVKKSDTLQANLYTEPEIDYYGTQYRGWGQFSFKGEKYSTEPLDESKLNLDETANYPTDVSAYTDSASLATLQSPALMNFITMNADGKRQLWRGSDSSVFVTDSLISSARLIAHDVAMDSLMEGESTLAVSRISETESTTLSLGGSIASIGAALSYTSSDTETKTVLDMLDLNGDGYPDIVNENDAQYTFPNGGLEQFARGHGAGASTTTANSDGFSLGGDGQDANTNGVKVTRSGASASIQLGDASIGVSVNFPMENEDKTESAFIDINADGLPDRVYKDGTVALNIGYSFLPAEPWGFGSINSNTSESQSAGLGVNLVACSWEFGFGINRSEGAANDDLVDINTDGLPDKLLVNGSEVSVQLNTGTGFGPAILWKDLTAVTQSVSTGESLNSAYTICIPIGFLFKICINPKVNAGNGVSRRLAQIMDINGDNFSDFVYSEKDGQLTVTPGYLGRTNMLKKVNRPMGSYFSMDYLRMGNTYDMPQSKWVLAAVEMYDGLTGDGADTMRRTFTYSNGLYNRREREFYGFDTVVTTELNTTASNSPYRRHIQHFINNSYTAKGLPVTEWMEDAAGNRYTQTDNEYELRRVQDSCFFPALLRSTTTSYEGQPGAGLSTTMRFDYDTLGNMTRIIDEGDGSSVDQVVAKITYHNVDAIYLKSTPLSITVNTVEGEKRRRSTRIDAQGNIIEISRYLKDGTVAVYTMDYDEYGNLSRITRPENYKQERMWYGYTYDGVTHSYVTKITDAFGYSSSSDYDYRFGETIRTISMNDEQMRYVLDDKGRISTITGPYEIKAGKPYTIKFEYNPDAAVPYALTRHYDPIYADDILTYTFTDGMARPVQVKKYVSLFRGKGVSDDLEMTISGRQIYDAFGRTTASYYLLTEPVGTANNQFNTRFGLPASTANYDVVDRNIRTVLADGAATAVVYSIKEGFFSTLVTDALGNRKESYTDVRERNRKAIAFGGPNGDITTLFDYNALNELTRVTDDAGNRTLYGYDNFGRKTAVNHPDAGLTEMQYDPAGNLRKKITPQIRKEIPDGGAIEYQYDYERLSDIDYPRYYQNKVKYNYGDPGTGAKAGRLMLQQDASGGQEFFYGPLGEIIKTIRTVVINPVYAVTYVSEQEYDTWNRIRTMTYPDGEKLTYHYNRAGSLHSMDAEKLGSKYNYVQQLGYDEYDQRVYLLYGNGTENTYDYDSLRRRLTLLQANTRAGRAFMNNTYRYDAVNNILGIENNMVPDSSLLGGYARQDYEYDNLYRLTAANGQYRGFKQTRSYRLSMTYDNLWNIVDKEQIVDTIPMRSYKQRYEYKGMAPHQPSRIGIKNYRYDANGNMLGDGFSDYFWDEENRLRAVLSNGLLSEYTYDANGERAVKSSGGVQGIWVNGAPAGMVRHYDNWTAYVSPYLVTRRTDFTKHYYIETQRITSKMGNGQFTNISFPKAPLTAGGVDYLARMQGFERARKDYYASQGVSPGPPTDKNFWARPENNGIQAPVLVDSTASDIPPGWPVGNTTPPIDGPPIFVDTIPRNDSVKAGYGFKGTGFEYEKNQYFYHPDHLGSTSYITDALGEINQHYEYSAFGETFYQEHATDYKVPYLFNAKEKDVETGLYYYGARYYNPETSIWQSVDPMAEKYAVLSPYNYTLNNPVKLIDPDGNEPIINRVQNSINTSYKNFVQKIEPSGNVKDKYEEGIKTIDKSVNIINPGVSIGILSRHREKEVEAGKGKVEAGLAKIEISMDKDKDWNFSLDVLYAKASTTVNTYKGVKSEIGYGFSAFNAEGTLTQSNNFTGTHDFLNKKPVLEFGRSLESNNYRLNRFFSISFNGKITLDAIKFYQGANNLKEAGSLYINQILKDE